MTVLESLPLPLLFFAIFVFTVGTRLTAVTAAVAGRAPLVVIALLQLKKENF